MAASLGAYQFDNLVQGRIPFLFVNLGVDTSPTYLHIYKMHLEHTLFTLPEKDVTVATPEEIIAGIQAIKYPAFAAIVVVDQDASRSPVFAEALEKAGFTNAFFLRGGWSQLVEEKQAGF